MASEALTVKEIADLYRRYGMLLRRRCRTLLRDESLAEDALQEAFVKTIRAGAEIARVDQPLRWLYRVVDRCCFDHLRKRKHLATSTEIPDPVGPHPGVQIEIRDAVIAILADLSDDDRRIAALAFVDGLPQAEIGAEVGLSRITVNKRVQSIRERAVRILDGRVPDSARSVS